jgi:hypothetical protein
MQEEQIREALNKHWQASAAGDAGAEHDIYDDDAVCDYPQSGERILGRSNLQALRSHHPGKPSGFNVKRILGKDDLWITEYTITYQGRPAYTVSIMEFREGKVVHETQYFADPFEAPAWRSQWGTRFNRPSWLAMALALILALAGVAGGKLSHLCLGNVAAPSMVDWPQ